MYRPSCGGSNAWCPLTVFHVGAGPHMLQTKEVAGEPGGETKEAAGEPEDATVVGELVSRCQADAAQMCGGPILHFAAK